MSTPTFLASICILPSTFLPHSCEVSTCSGGQCPSPLSSFSSSSASVKKPGKNTRTFSLCSASMFLGCQFSLLLYVVQLARTLGEIFQTFEFGQSHTLSRAVRPLKITSLRSSRSSDEKTISASPSVTSVAEKVGAQALTPQSTQMPPLPVYSTDVEVGHQRISHAGSFENCENFLEMGDVGRAYTCSIVVEADSVTLPTDRRPFSSPSICPVENISHDRDHDCDGIRVMINTVQSADELV